MTMQIRPFEEHDQAAVLALWAAVFDYSAPHNNPILAIQNKLKTQRELFFVADFNEKVVGTVMGGYDGHRGWIYSLAVNPEVRNQGIGSALMRHVEQALKEKGCPKINLQLLATNAQTIAFYRKLGFAVEERVSMGKSMLA